MNYYQEKVNKGLRIVQCFLDEETIDKLDKVATENYRNRKQQTEFIIKDWLKQTKNES